MKTLIVYFSRTGTTKKLAEDIKKSLKCDIEPITEDRNRKGVIGYLKSGREAGAEKTPLIHPPKKDLSKYDLVIIGTPIWVGKMSSPVRSFLKNNICNFKKVAFFCTMGGSKPDKTFAGMADVAGKKPLATIAVKTIDVKKGNYDLKEFINKLK